MQEIRTGIIGVGNCASSLVQGRYYYQDPEADIPGLITKNLGGYRACDIQFVAAFDVDKRKVGRDLSEAIFAEPNCTTVFQRDIPFLNCPVEMGYFIDSIPPKTTITRNQLVSGPRQIFTRARPRHGMPSSEAFGKSALK